MTSLVLGPILRHVGEHEATVWVETDGPCEVAVLGHRSPTFHVAGHHYAVVDVDGLDPGTEVPYTVALDGDVVWPPADGELPASTLRTWAPGRPYRILFGSCHQAGPHRAPWTLPVDEHELGSGADALHAWAGRLLAGDGPRPDALFLVGDQVYADELDPTMIGVLEERRGGPPRRGWPQVSTFEEYTWLYHEAWAPPLLRWLLSCIPSLMVFDDHDVIDDWNASAAWRRKIERRPWWQGRIDGALMSYWIYQHLGNATRHEREGDELLAAVRAAEDGEAVLRAFARRADVGTPQTGGHRWSYARDLGPARTVVLDSRNGRVLEEGRRSMMDGHEWAWVEEVATGGHDHLLLVTSLPWLLPRAIHDLEAWDAAVVAGGWGRVPARAGEWIRQAIDLEHWAAFGRSFEGLASIVGAVARGERGAPPATVLALSGDVHFAYVAEIDLGGESRVRQLVSSPLRQGVPMAERRVQRMMLTRPLALLAKALVRTTPGARTTRSWTVTEGPWFGNNIGMVTLDGRRARLSLHGVVLDDEGKPVLETLLERDL